MSTTKNKYEGMAGAPYGHVPGHQYQDVKVVLSQSRGAGWRMTATETWGSAQGYDEEHGRHEAVGHGDTPVEAARDLRGNATAIEDRGYLESAISEALDAWETDTESP